MLYDRMRHRDSAFTLIELIVVLFVLGLLITLIVPAALAARESARRVWCATNLKGIALASLQYETAFNTFPPGRLKTFDPRYAGVSPPCTAQFVDKGPLIFILPFIEQEPLFNAINQTTSVFSIENTTIHSVVVSTYACPSDGLAGVARQLDPALLGSFQVNKDGMPGSMVYASYGGSTGSFQSSALPMSQFYCRIDPVAVSQNNGCFNDLSRINTASITDGSSNTIFWLERSISAATRTDGATGLQEHQFGWYVSGNWGDTLLTTFYPANAPQVVAPAAIIARFNGASSMHPGGVNAAMADGSVRFVQQSVDSWSSDPFTGNPLGIIEQSAIFWSHVPKAGLWQNLATRSGGEVLDY